MVFYIFGTLALFASLMVVTQRNVVHSALYLILLFFSMAGLFIDLHAEFLAGIQVFLYAGGIMVMFIFVVMIINIPKAQKEPQFTKQRYFAIAGIVVLFFEVIYIIAGTTFKSPEASALAANTVNVTNTVAVGKLLYSKYLFTFEVASVLLLVAMIGAIILSSRRIRQREKLSRQDELLNKLNLK